jgi:hypothetical protein
MIRVRLGRFDAGAGATRALYCDDTLAFAAELGLKGGAAS